MEERGPAQNVPRSGLLTMSWGGDGGERGGGAGCSKFVLS